MNKIISEILNLCKKTLTGPRAMSLYWRTFDMLAIGLLDILLVTTQTADLPNWMVIFIGLVAGEVTKHLNKKKK